MNTMKFPAEIYARFRPRYPMALFELLAERLEQVGLPRQDLDIVEVACGAANATLALVKSGLPKEVRALDPDAEMVREARAVLQGEGLLDRVDLSVASGEATGLETKSADVVFCASAFHWMKREDAMKEFLRVLRRPGLVMLAEYTFPSSLKHQRFNDWIHAQLRGPWQNPHPRATMSFMEMASVFDEEGGGSFLGLDPVPMRIEMNWAQVVGLIRSQSRYVVYRNSLGDERARVEFDERVAREVEVLLGGETDTYDFGLQAATYFFGPGRT